MKLKIIYFIIIFVLNGTFLSFSQETARERLRQRQKTETSRNNIGIKLTARALQKNRDEYQNLENAKWMREIYRYLDLNNDKNVPLYNPVQPENGRINLFTLLFKLLSEGKINAYEYVDGKEIFSDKFKIDFKEFLDRFGVYYENKNGSITINDTDIPSAEVQGYYVKEAYYFETGTSNFGIKTLAICPILFRQGDYDGITTRYPLFWIKYDDIRPYAMRMPIMSSSLNNVMSGTVDDFFRKHDYQGIIYKTGNAQGKTISQSVSTPQEMKTRGDKIEKELKDFEDMLWRQEKVIPAPEKKEKQRLKKSIKNSSLESVTIRDRRF